MDANNTEQNKERLRKLLIKLPNICFDYFVAISSNTSILTRINYANDLNVFFDYLYETSDDFSEVTSCDDVTVAHIAKITSDNIEKYLDFTSIYKKNNTVITNQNAGKKRKLSAISSFYTYLIKHKLLSEDPTNIIDSPKIKEKPIIRLTSDEITKLINTVETGEGLSPRELEYHKKTVLRDCAIVVLLLDTGIRLSELIGIDMKDMFFEENAFKITRKGGNEAILYFSDYSHDILRRYYEQRAKNQIEGNDADALFLSMQNRRITHRAVEKLIKKYTRIVNPIKTISPHKLRSTFGTALYNNTGDIYLVADVLGHKDVNTTKKHYAAISEERRKEAPKHIDYFGK